MRFQLSKLADRFVQPTIQFTIAVRPDIGEQKFGPEFILRGGGYKEVGGKGRRRNSGAGIVQSRAKKWICLTFQPSFGLN